MKKVKLVYANNKVDDFLCVNVGDPLPPIYSNHSTDSGLAICLHVPDNLIVPVVYEVNITDSTGSLTRRSDINSSQCLNFTSDLYPAVCGPFQLSVAAINSVGRTVTQQTLLAEDNQPMPCDCFREKGNDIHHSCN
jgi:hypothetical protein